MESVVFIPSPSSQFGPRCGCSCRVQHGPLRPRYQFRRRWQPAPARTLPESSFLGSIFNQEDDEPSFTSMVFRVRDNASKNGKESAPSQEEAKTSQPAETQHGSKTAAETAPSKDDQESTKFEVSVQLGDGFTPEEISVKLAGRTLRVVAKHEDRFSFRQISRAFHLSDEVDIERLTSSLSAEGLLSIEAPKLPVKESGPSERIIPIQKLPAAKETAVNGRGETGPSETEHVPSDGATGDKPERSEPTGTEEKTEEKDEIASPITEGDKE